MRKTWIKYILSKVKHYSLIINSSYSLIFNLINSLIKLNIKLFNLIKLNILEYIKILMSKLNFKKLKEI